MRRFYAVSAAIDTQSEQIISCANRMLEKEANFDEIGEEIVICIVEMTRILNRMYEKCRPKVFYDRIRAYLKGWLNDPQLPDGLTYDLGPNETRKTMKLAGGSAAQNPTVQLLDILLGVKHGEDTDDLMISGCAGCQRMNYLKAMRTYMPREHEEYLNNLEEKFSKIIEKFKKCDSYNSCVMALTNFRSELNNMLTMYIVRQSETSRGTGVLVSAMEESSIEGGK